jgi:small subunit ribosomal protein S17
MPKRVLTGVVVSKSGDKTIKVQVVRRVVHPTYKKIIKKTKNFAAHDEHNKCQVGDTVKIQECRPMSATKRWEVLTAAA